MERDPQSFLWDARDSAETILRFTSGFNFDEYAGNSMLSSAVERHFITIGEALGALAKLSPDLGKRIPDLASIVGFRNLLVHGYGTVDPKAVWVIVREKLPTLRDDLNALLTELDSRAE